MSSTIRALFFAVVATAPAGILAQGLVCPPDTSAMTGPCERFHFHQQIFWPETHTFIDSYGVTQFASESACDLAREAGMKRNQAVVDFIRKARNDNRYELDRFGPCHCDLAFERSSPLFLDDAQRQAQVKLAQEVRMRVRERLLSAGLTSDSELVRALATAPTYPPQLATPKLFPLPLGAAPAPAANDPTAVKLTRVVDIGVAPVTNIDLPLAGAGVPTAPEPMPQAAAPATGSQPNSAAAAAPAAAPPSTAPAPAGAHVPVVAPAPAPATIPAPASAAPRSEPPIEEMVVSADSEPAEAFIHAETERVQNVLNASTSIADEATKAKVFEACMQRIQLLSSLRTLVEGAGVASRVATAMRGARTEPERLVLVGKLFGPEVAQHWAPKTAAEIVLEPAPQDGESDRVLRDISGKYTEAQKKRALYLVLSRSQPTEDQQLGLGAIIESSLP